MSEVRTDSLVNQSGDNDSGIDLSTNDVVAIKTANSEALRVDSSGNVGIGTTSPAVDLEIRGSGASGQIYLGGSTDTVYSQIFSNNDGIFIIDADKGNVGADPSFRVKVGNAEAMRISSSGDVGIGTTSPDTNFDVERSSNDTGGIKVQNTNNTQASAVAQVEISGGDNAYANLLLECSGTNHSIRQDGSGNLKFINASTERMRIDSSGNLLVGTTSAGGDGVTIRGAQGGNFWSSKSNTTSADNQLAFYNPNGLAGYIQTSGSSTSYNTSSDYRLKENVTADWDATTRLKQLNPVRFNFIADPDTTVDGFLAHEVQDIVPEAISGTKDEVDEDGNAMMQGIDQSKLVPLLVKTIQELEARIAALENA